MPSLLAQMALEGEDVETTLQTWEATNLGQRISILLEPLSSDWNIHMHVFFLGDRKEELKTQNSPRFIITGNTKPGCEMQQPRCLENGPGCGKSWFL